MYAIKGAWAGRTYALANSNDSGGRKSRVRRSKEERKELVVSFIQRHQKLNNGSFPSLNLTHKEVGGSFYIVREIVREVIQENRVLAPPKLLPGEQNMESFLEQYPLGSISVDPQIDVVSSNERVLVNHHQYKSKEQTMDSRPIIELDQGTLDSGKIVNGSTYADAESKESKGLINVDILLEKAQKGAEADKTGVGELDAYLLTESNIVEDVGEEISSPEEHNVENFMEEVSTGSSSIDLQIDVQSLDESEIGVTNEEQVPKSDKDIYVNGTIVNGSSNAGEASSFPEERGVENFMEQGPTTFSTIDRQIDVKLVDESEIAVSYHKAEDEEQVLDATDILLSDQESLVNGTVVNGISKQVAESEESKEPVDATSLLERGDIDEVKELEAYQSTNQTEESLVVETFPLRPVPQIDFDSDEELNKSAVSVGALKKPNTDGLQVEAVKNSVPEKALLINESIDLEAKDTLPTGNKPKVGANGILQQAASDKAAPNKQQFDIADVGSSKIKGSNPTLDRPKLESWEATTEKSAGKEADNPLMAFVKAFVTAFVKFWSE